VDPDSLAPLLEITADAYGRPGTRVRLVAYQTDPIGVSGSTGVTGVTGVTQEPRASAEIEEIGWFTGADSARCAPAVQLALRQLHERGLLPPAPTPTPM
jgi:hypothetical protein